ncbi:hypothetical protein M0R04_09725 [Candidatus Dojkabacteria bacterium]|nr:hypothetical protein [Candidatus Dojkabacteria bacterium]
MKKEERLKRLEFEVLSLKHKYRIITNTIIALALFLSVVVVYGVIISFFDSMEMREVEKQNLITHPPKVIDDYCRGSTMHYFRNKESHGAYYGYSRIEILSEVNDYYEDCIITELKKDHLIK